LRGLIRQPDSDWTIKRSTGSNWNRGQSGARCKIAAVPKKARENLQQVLSYVGVSGGVCQDRLLHCKKASPVRFASAHHRVRLLGGSQIHSGQSGPFERNLVGFIPNQLPKVVELDEFDVSINETDIDGTGHSLGHGPVPGRLGGGT
jgi:hypothetical protein